MFKFLKKLFERKQPSSTATPTRKEITDLKQALQAEIKRTCEAAKKGDTDATLKLQAFKETLEERSVRLTGKPKPPTTVVQGGLE